MSDSCLYSGSVPDEDLLLSVISRALLTQYIAGKCM